MNLALPTPFPFRSAMDALLHLRLPMSRCETVATRPLAPRRALQKDAVWMLPHPRGVRIECLSGELWITQDWQRRDVFLAPGQSHAIDSAHRLLVQALQTAQFQLRPV